jgi:hypothetical protein
MTDNNVPLRDYVDTQCHFLERRIDERFNEVSRATELAKEEVDRRLASMNEFRGALSDKDKLLITRAEYYIQHEKLSEEVKLLRTFKDEQYGKASQASVFIAYLISAISIVLAVIGFFIK